MRIMHVITGLETGGAETMLYKLTSFRRKSVLENMVISMTSIGPIGEKMQAAGIRVESLGMERGIPDPRYIHRLAAMMRQENPDLVQTWLYHADLMGGLAANIAGIPVIWNIRQSTPKTSGTKPLAWFSSMMCAKLSGRIPQKIVCCSESAAETHQMMGYDARKFVIIPNGFDLEQFCPDSEEYESVRRELGVDSKHLIIGHAARYHPMKDHRTFLEACAVVHQLHPEVHFILCGDGVHPGNQELMKQVYAHHLSGVCHLLGRRDDMTRITAAFDIACLSSINGEGFPNVIGEAMACAVPCVVTDVGGSAAIVGDTGIVVQPGSPHDLANGLIKMIEMGRQRRNLLGEFAHDRIYRRYSLPEVVLQYENLYLSLQPSISYSRVNS